MSKGFKDFSKKQYKEIDKKELSDGVVFICQTVGYHDPFQGWDFAVGRMDGNRAEVLGKFKDTIFAKVFALGI